MHKVRVSSGTVGITYKGAERSGGASTSVATIAPAEGLLLMLRVHERMPCPSATVASTRPFTPGSADYTLHSLPGRRSDNPHCFDEGTSHEDGTVPMVPQ